MLDPHNRLAKLNVATALLNKGSLYLHLDPRVTDVKVPPWLSHQPQLVLQVGYDLPIPIPDLRVDGKGIYGTLSFSGTPFICNAPWDSIFALVGDEGHGMIWDDSVPPEIAAEIERETQKAAHRKKTNPTETLKSLKPPLASKARMTKADKKPSPAKKSKLKLPSYLRVIK